MLKYKFSIRPPVISFILVISMLSPVCAQDAEDDYKKIVHTFNEAWNSGNYDLLDQTVHPEYFKQIGF